LLTPKVKVFFSATAKTQIRQVIVDLAESVGRDKIVSRESAADWGFRHLDELWMGVPAR
jgi:hypothetical protein